MHATTGTCLTWCLEKAKISSDLAFILKKKKTAVGKQVCFIKRNRDGWGPSFERILISETATAVLLELNQFKQLNYDKVCIIEDIFIDPWNIKM